MLKKFLLAFIFLGVITPQKTFAQPLTQPEKPTEKLNGTIEKIEEKEGSPKVLTIKTSKDTTITSEIAPTDPNHSVKYKEGDKVIIQKLQMGDGTEKYIVTDFNRLGYLKFLFVIFVILCIAVGKKYGVYSLLGMFLSFLVVFKFVLPKISGGANPILITVLASFVIVPITFYLSHGFSKKTHVAVISTFIALTLTSLFSALSVNLARLTGLSSDEAMFLILGDDTINIRGIFLAGIIIGFLGVMDDVTVSQAGIVMKLNETKRHASISDLYTGAMEIGRDHITSMTNTLILVYTGASLPLLLMFTKSSMGNSEVLNAEIIAAEIVRTLVGSIGLIISVPISTFLAAFAAKEM